MEWSGWQVEWSVARADVEAARGNGPIAEATIVFASPEDMKGTGVWVHPALDGALRDLFRRGSFGANAGETAMLPSLGLLPEAYVIAAGRGAASFGIRELRLAAGAVGKALAGLKAESATWVIPAALTADAFDGTVPEAASAVAEGLLLASYRRDSRSAEGRKLPSPKLFFDLENGESADAWSRGFERGVKTADAVCYARELTNLPGNRLTPATLAEEAESLAERFGLECRIYDEIEAAAEGMGGLLAVGQGSVNPPRMIVLRHKGAPNSTETIGLIGKGVTFDTGGISLKKPEGMEEMISDMGGAAAVLGVMRAVAERKLAVNVTAVIPAAENMPSGNAFKPGDVIRMYSGQTVEVLNTDAEGRLVLADGLTTAIRAGATRLIDIATLTGAVMVALGDVTTGAVTNDDTWLSQLDLASRRAGEYLWQLPAHPEYRKALRSDVADLKNMGSKWGGAIFGGLFVGAFAEDRPWIHLDIGGTAWMWSDRDLEPAGGTGVMVRTLIEYLESEALAGA
ncbi:leucyl aminopeptidase [Cohnella faecalis]|uniref:Probable cytosol aminopeptidase n=1 Tax=Cohnella faecalis TaxID=2315694 RepID=A0A398CMZ1_9BACL|nr:leucyl aminopeptidase [Cohnella faecalis]RIE03662.1 leucyl aminopeptidase [Cohnella faecalis]